MVMYSKTKNFLLITFNVFAFIILLFLTCELMIKFVEGQNNLNNQALIHLIFLSVFLFIFTLLVIDGIKGVIYKKK